MNKKIKYQFCIDGRPASSVRDDWKDAAQGFVNAGYGRWSFDKETINIEATQGAEIKRTSQ